MRVISTPVCLKSCLWDVVKMTANQGTSKYLFLERRTMLCVPEVATSRHLRHTSDERVDRAAGAIRQNKCRYILLINVYLFTAPDLTN